MIYTYRKDTPRAGQICTDDGEIARYEQEGSGQIELYAANEIQARCFAASDLHYADSHPDSSFSRTRATRVLQHIGAELPGVKSAEDRP